MRKAKWFRDGRWGVAVSVVVGLVMASRAGAADFSCDNLTVLLKIKQDGSTNTGLSSSAFNNHTTASGNASHSEGNFSVASGDASHAEGGHSTAGNDCSHAEGSYSTASGLASHAEGSNTMAVGTWSHVEGSGTAASGAVSHAEGQLTTAGAVRSHAGGYYAIVLPQHTNAFIHATGAAGTLKQSLYKDTAHFDRLITLEAANDSSNSVLNRAENDVRYATTNQGGKADTALQPNTAISVSGIASSGGITGTSVAVSGSISGSNVTATGIVNAAGGLQWNGQDTDARYVNVTGGVMTGALNLPDSGLRVGTSSLIATNVTGLGSCVGIGTASPSATLHVAGAGRFDQGITYVPALGDLSMGTFTNQP